MRLIQFNCDGDEYFINPDKIKWLRLKAQGFSGQIKNTIITFDDDSEMVVDHTVSQVVCRINNQELNVGYDCMREIEGLKQKIKNLGRITAPA
jgi:hypothetical protein